ncbi:ATP-binding protein [Halobacterium yunchengense]|uniref:ATP-binding protein n=1 Tax=Halobacterium yunchengense TaxID=3108497 RepID=UPI00300BA6B1
MDVLGRESLGAESTAAGARGRLGRYLATDGSLGAPVGVDLARPHAGVVVGKRGSGKSYTLGVLAEALADAPGVAPVVVDPMGAFRGLAAAGLAVREPAVRADALPPRAWCRLLDLDPASAAGTLVWRAAAECDALAGMREWVAGAHAGDAARRAAANHLALAASWGCFAPDAPRVGELLEGGSVLDCTGLAGAALRAVGCAVADALYRAAVEGARPLPWLLVDEAHACVSGPAADAVGTLYTRGRAPGASVVLATQRPSALPEAAVSQSDLVVAHRLTSGRDVDALAATRPTYLDGALGERLPARTGDALVVDDASESAVTVRVRERRTEHGGEERVVDRGETAG